MTQQKIKLVDGKFIVEEAEKREVKVYSAEPVRKKEYSEKAMELRERVRQGNQKLYDAWKKICDIDHSTQAWKDELERWHQATKRLGVLCYNLQGAGFEDCLYIESDGKRTRGCLNNPDGFWCQVCPSSYPYWHEDAKTFIFEEGKEK